MLTNFRKLTLSAQFKSLQTKGEFPIVSRSFVFTSCLRWLCYECVKLPSLLETREEAKLSNANEILLRSEFFFNAVLKEQQSARKSLDRRDPSRVSWSSSL